MYKNTQDYHDLISDYLNGPTDEETWNDLREMAEAILLAYISRNDVEDEVL